MTRTTRRRWLVGGAAAVGAVVAAGLTVPVPGLESLAVAQIRDQVACPGTLARPPQVTIMGRVAPQLLRQRLSEVHVTVPDVTLNGVPHASFTATLRDVGRARDDAAYASGVDAAITVPFASLPAPGPSFARQPDGTIAAGVSVPAAAAANVKAKLYLRMQLRGTAVRTVPQRLEIFGRTLPAKQVAELTGGVREEQLSALPEGVAYESVTPRSDGVHVTLSGVTRTALSALPVSVGGRAVSYAVDDDRLAIRTTAGGVPLTVFAVPTLAGGQVTLTPQTVRILGAERRKTNFLSRLVLAQIKPDDLSRALPALPAGVRYRSVSVDAAGIKVALGGTTVKPFSELTRPPGRPTTFGAENGLLTAVTSPEEATPIVLHARPTIRGTTLDIAPETIEMFGARFPAADVLDKIRSAPTTFPLQTLPPGLTYQDVEVLPDALRIRLTGSNVTIKRGELTGAPC